MTPPQPPIHAVLLDIDGTLYFAGDWIDSALDTVRWLLNRNLQVRFLTNTTTTSRRAVCQRFAPHLDVPEDWFFTPARAAYRWFRAQASPPTSILPLVHSDVLPDLGDLPLVHDENADVVLLGDMDDEWTIDALNTGLRALLNGATLVALARNRHWKARDGYRLDIGAFVAALEYGADARCETVFGKPNPVFFSAPLNEMGIEPGHALMVGDDLEGDVIGAVNAGLQGVLVKTGKFRPALLDNIPAHIPAIDSIAVLPDLLRES
ncbi:MAG: HAD hydrolase-like protein [Chloroflexi bacterium]|nr:HAD hydrolase-like protein [Chloroflexota bacterium]